MLLGTMSSAILARVGRHRQRYENEFRLVAGCIPYKLVPVDKHDADEFCVKKKEDNTVYRLVILMISSPNRHDCVFPKGGWENDETMEEAACREALEEAGVQGILNETKLGEWIFRSKSRQNSCSNEGACKGYMFAMEVNEELDCWPEQSSHMRKWVSVRDAYSLCRYPWMHEALAAFEKLLSENMELPRDKLSKIPSYQDELSYQEPSSCFAVRERTIEVSYQPRVLLVDGS